MPKRNLESLPRGGSDKTRILLRKEVNFGCAICGEPYLTYHHFNPTWAEKNHDNPKGMIALCVRHASQADGGAYTVGQLDNYKRNPFLADKNLNSYFEWRRKKFLYCVGGNFCIDADVLIMAKDKKIIWQSYDDVSGMKTLSLSITDANNRVILKMNKNQWESDPRIVADIDSSTLGQKLKVISKTDDSKFQIWFRVLTLQQLRNIMIKGYENSSKTDDRGLSDVQKIILGLTHQSPESKTDQFMINIEREFGKSVPICFLEGIFYLPNKVTLTKYVTEYSGCRFKMNTFLGRHKTVFTFSDNIMVGGV